MHKMGILWLNIFRKEKIWNFWNKETMSSSLVQLWKVVKLRCNCRIKVYSSNLWPTYKLQTPQTTTAPRFTVYLSLVTCHSPSPPPGKSTWVSTVYATYFRCTPHFVSVCVCWTQRYVNNGHGFHFLLVLPIIFYP